MSGFISRLLADESGAAAIEYALLASMLSIAGIAWLDALGWSLSAMFDAVSTKLSVAAQTPASEPAAAGGSGDGAPVPGPGAHSD